MGKTEKEKTRIEKQMDLGLPMYTVSEEIINSVTHAVGAIFGLFFYFLLIRSCPKDFLSMFCVSIYGFAVFFLYLVSSLYHAMKVCKAKKIFRILDHCSIFFLIAGTYTPVCFFKLGKLGLVILSMVWLVTIAGIILNSINLNKYSKVSFGFYLFLGWAVIFTIKPLVESVTPSQFCFLSSGGLVYTLGAVFYFLGKKVKYIHSVWHIFVLSGTFLQFLMIYSFFN